MTRCICGSETYDDFKKQRIRSSKQDSLNIVSVVADIMKDPVGRKLYTKLQLIDPDSLDGYVEGVIDALNLTGQSVDGFDRFYDMIQEHGIESVQEVMKATN